MWDIAGYWTGSKREGNKREVQEAWDKVLQNFHGKFPVNSSTKQLGKRLFEQLDKIQTMFNSLQPLTLCHGDYKVSNVFLDKLSPDDVTVYAIDWQWFGPGSPALDVMYFMATSVEASKLSEQKDLIKFYHSTLISNGVVDYPFSLFYKQFQLCYIDFFVYTIVAKWQNMKPQEFKEYQDELKDGLHLRSFVHMKHIIECAELYLNELDKNG